MSYLPISTYIVHRFIDPLVCIVVGALVSIVSHPLGLWLMFSGAALGIFEQAIYERSLDQILDQIDGLVDSDVQSQVVEHFTGGTTGKPSETPLSLEDTAGIPTGLAPDLTKQIARRQKRAPLSDTPTPLPSGLTYSQGAAPAQDDQAAAVASVATDDASARRAPDNLA